MSLYDQVKNDMTQALKDGDSDRRFRLTYLMSSLNYSKIDKKFNETLSDADTISVIQKSIKRCEETLAQSEDRPDHIDRNIKEIELLKAYLPTMLNEEETQKLARQVISELSATTMKDMGSVMKECSMRVANIDKSLLSKIVKESLNAGY